MGLVKRPTLRSRGAGGGEPSGEFSSGSSLSVLELSLEKMLEAESDVVELLPLVAYGSSDAELLALDPSLGAESGREARSREAIEFDAGRGAANGFDAGRGAANGCEVRRRGTDGFEADGRAAGGRGGSE